MTALRHLWRHDPAPILLLAWLIPVVVTLSWLIPPWQSADEPVHLVRAVEIAHGELIPHRAQGTAGGMSDLNIWFAFEPFKPVVMQPTHAIHRADLDRSGQVQWNSQLTFLSFPAAAQYAPVYYLTDVAAYWIGRMTRLSIDRTLILARLINGAIFAAAAAIAIAIARRARFLLAATIMLPMTLSLACSASQDSLMLSTTILVVATLDRIVHDQRRATGRELAGLTIGLALIGIARPPYAGFLLALLLAAPILERRSAWAIAAGSALVLAWCTLAAVHIMVHLGGANPAAQLAYLATNPGRILPIIGQTFNEYMGRYWVEFIGKLGWTDTALPHAYLVFVTIVLLVATLASTTGPSRRPWAPATGIGFAFVTIFLLQWLTWTWPGQSAITGVLGRYFGPLAMMLPIALPRVAVATRPLRLAATSALCAMAAITPAVILHATMLRFYLPG